MTDPIIIAGPVTAVTAFEDRAELTRTVQLTVPAGRVTVRLPGVTPLMDDARLTARCDGIEGATVEDVQIQRRWTLPTHPDAAPDAERKAELHALAAQQQAATRATQRALHHAQHRRDAARATLKRYLQQATHAVWRSDADWQSALPTLEAALATAHAAVTTAAEAHREAQAAGAQLAHTPANPEPSRLVADLEIRFTTPAAGPITLTVSGVTPCALWRPSHQAHLDAQGQITWTTYGTLWQSTGEAWHDVALELSTDRPALGAHLPKLAEDTLRLQAKAHKKQVVLAHRQEAISTDQGDAAVPGVDDGGETRILRASSPVTLPSDGRPHRIATDHFESPSTLRLLTRPDLARHVFLTADLRNTSPQPILAGPVILMRDGAYVGTGDVPFIGAGERFELSYGSDDRWTVTYRRRRRTEERMLAKDRTHFTQEVDLQYAGPGEAQLDVELSMPVTELAALNVQPSSDPTYNTEGTPAPDEDGRLTLPITVKRGAKRRLSVGFWLDRTGDVVLPDPW